MKVYPVILINVVVLIEWDQNSLTYFSGIVSRNLSESKKLWRSNSLFLNLASELFFDRNIRGFIPEYVNGDSACDDDDTPKESDRA